ncbi:MAG TPA: ATP-binding protein [Candidatus Bathyarchaeia archaeon]|nr:ATP-binding protein [Candidatus Bathyarchaeia archaeon]
MRQLTVISGKGGTGKTSLVGSFAVLAENKVIADCDVDAPDLHLLLHPEILTKQEFKGLKVAVMDKTLCTECGTCEETCRFNAIASTEGSGYAVNPARCEGCGACVFTCPQEALSLKERVSGYAYISKTNYGTLVHAQLNVAEEASGKLVTLVRENARQIAEKEGCNLILIDGAPGIGCSVIASLGGVDLALIVTEPTQSGMHDLKRILSVVEYFGVKPSVCINKYDINEEVTEEIEAFCREKGIEIAGKILYDDTITKAMVAGVPVVAFESELKSTAAEEITLMWHRIEQIIQE